jgi:hypothetical protein
MKSGIWSGARRLLGVTGVAVAGILASGSAHAALIPLGDVFFDVTVPGSTANIDIGNFTGSNAAPAFGFPVTTPVTLSGLNLVVTFSDASTATFTQSAFTLSLDGQSYDGPTIAIGGSAQPVKAVLDGTLSPTSINDGSPETVDASFVEAIITDAAGDLEDGDFAEIDATTATGGGGAVPEPGTLALFGSGLLGLGLFVRRRRENSSFFRLPLAAAASILVAGGTMLVPGSASADATLQAAASPSTGVAGVTFVNVIAGGVPHGTLASSITVAIAPTCALGSSVSGEVTTTASKITPVGALSRVQFEIPGSLAQGTYLVSISGPGFGSTDCSVLGVTHSNATLNACLPTSSMAVALGATVTAYVPNGAWDFGSAGVQAVPLEGGGSPVSISTPNTVNSCSSNPATGQTVCTANNTDVYLINGTTLSTTLTSGSSGLAGFSGGECNNCGVAINALTNTAYIAMGVAGSPSGDGIQPLNLNTNVFGTPFPTSFSVSENISVDPGRNLILSPDEEDVYDLLSLTNAGAITGEFGFSGIGGGGEYDSAAEDCTTGLALSSDEFTNNIILADLSQATFTSGSPGTWSAPTAVPTVIGADGAGYAAGTSGISVAPGGSHLGIVTGEFGGQAFAVLQLPAAAGTGGTPPALVDFAEINSLPNTPDGAGFSAGFDPHTITAYTSPNTGKAMGVIADWATGTPSFVALIDLQKILSAPRLADGHTVDQTAFDVLATGAVTYIATH